jgi:RNA polymerase sigma-70 factor (ECF subfamily)
LKKAGATDRIHLGHGARMGQSEFIPTRQSLLSRLRSWDNQDSWREFFDTYWRLIYRVAVKAGLSDAEAQDVVQETVLSVAQRMPGFKYDPDIGSFKSWLMLIIRRRIADHLRRRYSRIEVEQSGYKSAEARPLEEIPDDSLDRLEAVWEEEWRAQVREAALERVKRRVKAEQFQMFDFSVLQGLPVREVAKTLGVSVMQVYLARHRIGNLLKSEMATLEKKIA